MRNRNYWLDLFTGKTWEEFLENGAAVSGFRRRRRKYARENIKVGDYFLCYLTGVQRFIGVLEVTSEYYYDEENRVWKDELFPCRFNVKLLHKLEPKTAVPVKEMLPRLSFFQGSDRPKAWTGLFRCSPTRFKPQDGELIVEDIREAVENPIEREFDPKLYWRVPRKFEARGRIVTVPEERQASEEKQRTDTRGPTHEEIQWHLLKLGAELGLDVWVARNDRNREFNDVQFKNMDRMRNKLPIHFDEATNKTIELIDVLWLHGDAIVAAFEVEHSTLIYSGLLRMSDLITMQPNIKISLYIAAPDDRAQRVLEEINRPTFARLKQPLPKICRFIPYSKLKGEMQAIGDRLKYMRPEFINEIAESCEVDEA